MPTLPAIQPHTEAKHHILRYYLDEWFPILGRTHNSLQYIDGFSGPGEYEGGEPGSPIIALRTLRRHEGFKRFTQRGGDIDFLFVDNNREFCRYLRRKIEQDSWPEAFRVEIKYDDFEDVVAHLLDSIAAGLQQMPPSLVFIDPFGPSGFSMGLLERLSSFKRVDVLINLNCLEFVQWILPDPSKHITADRLYGGPRWRPALRLNGNARTMFLVSEYELALQEIGWRGTSFEMVNNRNQTAYNLVFGTGSPKGMEAIKRAMRSSSQTGEFRYSDMIDTAQPALLGLDSSNGYPREIGDYLFGKYEGQEVSFGRLIEVEIDWHRRWLSSDLRQGLAYLEYGDDRRIVRVRNADGRSRRKRSYPDGCYVLFDRSSQRRLL